MPTDIRGSAWCPFWRECKTPCWAALTQDRIDIAEMNGVTLKVMTEKVPMLHS